MMLNVTIATSGDYLELDSDTWWESFGDYDTSARLTKSYVTYCESLDIVNDYATVETITAWLTSISTESEPTGLYGEGDVMVFDTHNEDNPFTSDAGYVYANIHSEDYWDTVVVEYTYDYHCRTNSNVWVWAITNQTDGAECLMYNDVSASCDYCETSWDSDNGGFTFYPQFQYGGERMKLESFVTYSEVTLENVTQCPICGHGPIHFGTYGGS